MVTSSRDGTVKAWDPARWQVQEPAEQPLRAVHGLAFAPDGKTLLTVSRHQPVSVLGLPIPGKTWNNLQLVTGPEPAVRVWDLASRRQQTVLAGEQAVPLRALALSPDGRTVAAGGAGGTVWLWDKASGRARPLWFISSQARAYWQLWESKSFFPIRFFPIQPNFQESIAAVAFSPDGSLLAAASEEGTVKVWDLASGRERATLPGPCSEVASLAFAPDGHMLAVNDRGRALLWVLPTGEVRPLDGHQGTINCLAFSPDGSVLATGAKDWSVKLWDLASGQEHMTLIGHTDSVAAVAFSPDGATLASGSWDATVKLWNRNTGQELVTLEGHSGKVHGVAFAPDGGLLASGGETPNGGGELYLWRGARELYSPR